MNRAAQALGRLAKGVTKTLTDEQRTFRAEQLAAARLKRKNKMSNEKEARVPAGQSGGGQWTAGGGGETKILQQETNKASSYAKEVGLPPSQVPDLVRMNLETRINKALPGDEVVRQMTQAHIRTAEAAYKPEALAHLTGTIESKPSDIPTALVEHSRVIEKYRK